MTKAMRLLASKQMIKELADAQTLVLVNPEKMTAAQSGELRADVRNAGARMRLLKNEVARHALKELGHETLAERLEGMTLVVWGEDSVAALKALYEYRSKNRVPEIRAGSIDGKITEPKDLEVLSRLPSRKDMLSQFLSTMVAPISCFASVLNNIAGQFVQVLDAIRREKEKSK